MEEVHIVVEPIPVTLGYTPRTLSSASGTTPLPRESIVAVSLPAAGGERTAPHFRQS